MDDVTLGLVHATSTLDELSLSDPSLPIYRIIEAQAARRPQAIAVRYLDLSLSYVELNSRANQLARALLAQGLTTGAVVASFFEPSLDVMIALLAIHKAGGIYVPLDPNHPSERIEQILSEVEPAFVLSHTPALARLPASPASVLCLDRDAELWAQQTRDNLPETIALTATAYIIFTSGTTGKPKGVMASHANLQHFILVARDTYGFCASDRMPAMARFTFSISLFELLTPLCAGGELHVIPRAHVLDFAQLHSLLKRITVIHTSPSLMRNVFNYLDGLALCADSFEQIRHASCGGDFVPYELLERMKLKFRQAEIFVIYGCSEIACMGCTFPVPRTRSLNANRVGSAMRNVGLLLLDEQQQRVAQGEKGEVYFCGAGLNQAYWKLPELTSQRFLQIAGQRYYRTGDVGRIDVEGNLELLGRADFQIKLSGVRIEPVEVENALRRAPGVRDALVALKTWEDQENKILVAYLLAMDEGKLKLAEIRSFVQQVLPDYMQPKLYLQLDAFPTNINGKLDRNALPAPSYDKVLTQGDESLPCGEIEEKLAKIWRSLLGEISIRRGSDFFALGGDSLLCVQMLLLLEAQFSLRLSLEQVLAAPSLSDLAKVIQRAQTGCANAELSKGVVSLKQGGQLAPIFCVYGVLLYRSLSQALATPRPILAAYLPQEMDWLASRPQDPQVPGMSLEQIAAQYLRLLKSVQPHPPYYLLGESFGGLIAFEMAQQLRRNGEQVALLAMLDCYAPNTQYAKAKTLAQRLALHSQLLREHGFAYIKKVVRRRLARSWQSWAARCLPMWLSLFKRVPVAMQAAAGLQNQRLTCNRISDAYHPQTYPEPLVFFRAQQRNPFEHDETNDMGWGRLAPQLRTYDIPGDHLSILEGENVKILAHHLLAHVPGNDELSHLLK